MPTKRYAPLLATIANAAAMPLVTSTDGPAGRAGREVRAIFAELMDAAIADVITVGDARYELLHWSASHVASLQATVRTLLVGLFEMRERTEGHLLSEEISVQGLTFAPT